eukprot:13827841-Alexandrium_andersonii.AAC.1
MASCETDKEVVVNYHHMVTLTFVDPNSQEQAETARQCLGWQWPKRVEVPASIESGDQWDLDS